MQADDNPYGMLYVAIHQSNSEVNDDSAIEQAAIIPAVIPIFFTPITGIKMANNQLVTQDVKASREATKPA
jgi:hypothetical protein